MSMPRVIGECEGCGRSLWSDHDAGQSMCVDCRSNAELLDAKDRIRELEAEVAYWKDSHIKADESWADGVREGIERVRKSPLAEDMRRDEEAVGFHCDAALAAFKREQRDGTSAPAADDRRNVTSEEQPRD